MMAMMQKMMNITTAITPEEDQKRKQSKNQNLSHLRNTLPMHSS